MLPKSDAAKYAGKHSNTTLLPTGKLRFDQTGMEFPANATRAALDAYATGKAFRRAVARRANEAYNFSVHEPYILPHKDRDQRHFLYCTLTKSTLPRDHTVVQNHVSAKRFQRLRKELEERKQKQKEEADKRREKRARVASARKAADVVETEVAMEQDGNDVLDGIISDEDESIDSDAEPNRVDKSGNEGQEQNIQDDRMEEDEKEVGEKQTFWVRGRKDARHDMKDDDGDDNEEWGEPDKKDVLPKRTKKKKSATKSKPGTSNASANESQKQDTLTGKRNRVTATVPKKVRQARQRRKTKRIENRLTNGPREVSNCCEDNVCCG